MAIKIPQTDHSVPEQARTKARNWKFKSNFKLLMPIPVHEDCAWTFFMEIPFSLPIFTNIQKEIPLFTKDTLVSKSFSEDQGLKRLQQIQLSFLLSNSAAIHSN